MTIQVFVSYRRGDSPHAAGRLVDRLNEHFKLFLDVDRIRPGADFTSVVREAVDKSDVLVAVIGSRWLTLTAENGGRRIDQPGDWVAEEIGTALRRGALVIPVLVDGADMPSRDELPPALADLANRQALKIAYDSFAADSRRLIETIEEMVSAATPQTVNLWDDPDYPQARGAFLQGLWPAAIEGFERVLHRHPRQQHVVEQLEQARRSQHLLELAATAESAADADRWQEVVDTLKAIDALQPSDEVKDRLTQAEFSLRIDELQNDVRALTRTGNWKAVLAADAELARLDADAADPEGWPPRHAPNSLKRSSLPATPEPSSNLITAIGPAQSRLSSPFSIDGRAIRTPSRCSRWPDARARLRRWSLSPSRRHRNLRPQTRHSRARRLGVWLPRLSPGRRQGSLSLPAPPLRTWRRRLPGADHARGRP